MTKINILTCKFDRIEFDNPPWGKSALMISTKQYVDLKNVNLKEIEIVRRKRSNELEIRIHYSEVKNVSVKKK